MRRATREEWRLLSSALDRWKGLRLPNGLAREKLGSKFDVQRLLRSGRFKPSQAAIGVKVELEHTSRPELALEIALAHLLERSNYYALLEKMEEGR